VLLLSCRGWLHVINGNDPSLNTLTLPSSIGIDANCIFENFPKSVKWPNGLTSTVNFKGESTPTVAVAAGDCYDDLTAMRGPLNPATGTYPATGALVTYVTNTAYIHLQSGVRTTIGTLNLGANPTILKDLGDLSGITIQSDATKQVEIR
jgi:hypothetical protein